jgi:Ca2+-binding EF-hand superfamily protein
MSFPVPLEETEITGHVRRFDRRHVIPSGGELSVPFATNFNDHQVAPGLPSKNTIHRQHYNVYGEHKEAFANPVGAARRSSVAASSGDGNHRYSNMGGFARKQRDLERLRERTLAKQKRDPKTNAMHQAATQLATSNLNTKSLFQHFDRNQDGTINFNSFSNGLRLAGVKTPTSIQRELFDNSANNGQLDYKRFVDDMKIKSNLINNQRTSLEIEDPHEQHKERKEQNARDRKYGDGYGLNLRSNSILPGRIIGEGSNAFTSATKRRLAWNDMSKSDKQQHLVHDHVMRSLQEKSDKVEAAFVSVDKQRDGCLNNSEFQQGLKRVGITLSPEDASSFFSGLPRRSDGLLDYHQFAEFLQRSKVKHYSLGQVRATNYTKHNSRSHIVQQRVADAVAAKRKNLEIVFREKDQGRGGRDSIARRDGLVSIHDVDDVLKSCGVILSNQDTERLFDRVDLNSNGLVSYHDFLKSTCGEYAIDLPESTEDKKRRVRHLRSWNAISGAKDSGELPEDLVVKEAWQRGRRPSVVSVKNPANILQKKERDQLVTQQRIVNLYAKHAIELKEVFAVHQDEPIDENQFLRGTQLAGISIASSDAKRLFASLSSKDAATGRSYVDGKSFIKTLESYDLTGVEFHGDAGPNGKMKPMEKKKRIFDETESQHAQDRGLFGPPPPLPSHTNTGTLVGHQHHTHFVSDPASKKTNDWIMGKRRKTSLLLFVLLGDRGSFFLQASSHIFPSLCQN